MYLKETKEKKQSYITEPTVLTEGFAKLGKLGLLKKNLESEETTRKTDKTKGEMFDVNVQHHVYQKLKFSRNNASMHGGRGVLIWSCFEATACSH